MHVKNLVSPRSTVSSSINALAAVTMEDLVKPRFPSLSEKSLSWVSQGMSKLSFHNSILTLGDHFLEIPEITFHGKQCECMHACDLMQSWPYLQSRFGIYFTQLSGDHKEQFPGVLCGFLFHLLPIPNLCQNSQLLLKIQFNPCQCMAKNTTIL